MHRLSGYLTARALAIVLISVLTASGSVAGQDDAEFPLAEGGPYAVGQMALRLVDDTRDGREVMVRLLYPAVAPAGAGPRAMTRDALPDLSAAPYPLVLTGYNTGDVFAHHLPSHGYVMAVVVHTSSVDHWDRSLVDYPRDLVFTLNQLADSPPETLAGLIDFEHVAAIGYSWDGYGALAVSGAQVDPAHYLEVCADSGLAELGYPIWWYRYACQPAEGWDAFKDEVGLSDASDAELWPAITDERIDAVAPMGPEGVLWFGPRGLASVELPALILAGTEDTINPYSQEAVTLYEALAVGDPILISFVDEGHMMVMEGQPWRRMRHLVTAFLGYHLQGRMDYADLMSEAFVSGVDGLAWGPVAGH